MIFRNGPLSMAKVITLLLVLFCLSSAEATAIKPRQSALKVMVVGDSITHGHEGDYTWRYRIWQWFRDYTNVAVQFVGPYSGTTPADEPGPPTAPAFLGASAPPAEPPRTNGGYAHDVDPGFLSNCNHFSVWGRQISQDIGLIRGLVSTYQPDMLLVELGFNDMGWLFTSGDQTLHLLGQFIQEARAGKPNLKFVIGTIPQRTYIGGRDDLVYNTDYFNGALIWYVTSWSTSQSPVEIARVAEAYGCGPKNGCPAAHDGLHPNALGEYQIAQAFSNTLWQSFGMGTGELSIPSSIPPRPCPAVNNLRAVNSPWGVTVTWDAVYGAFGYQVQTNVNDGGWKLSSAGANRLDSTWAVEGEKFYYTVATNCGDTQGTSPWVLPVEIIAHPTTAPGPKNIAVTSTLGGFDVSWQPPDGAWDIELYVLYYFDKDLEGAFLQEHSIAGTSASISGLTPGHHYVVAVSTWTRQQGGGFPRVANSVTAGYGTPDTPYAVDVVTGPDNGATIQMTWAGDPGSAGYAIEVYNATSGKLVSEGSADTPCYYETFLFPGAWHFAFCVRAYNGNATSGLSACVVPPTTVTQGVPACVPYTATDPGKPWPTNTDNGPGNEGPGGGGGDGDDDDGDDSPPPPAVDYPDCPDYDSYTSVDDIINDQSISEYCVNTYLIGALSQTLTSALSNYTDILNNGYTRYYNDYVKAVRTTAPDAWLKFYQTDMYQYFTCTYSVPDGEYSTHFTNRTGGCPPNNMPDWASGRAYNIYFAPNNNNWAPILDVVSSKYGISPLWISPYTYRTIGCTTYQGGPSCDQYGNVYTWSVNDSIPVPDPSGAISAALDQYRGLADWLAEAAGLSSASLYPIADADVIEGSVMSVYSVVAAVTAMRQVVEIGQEYEDAKALEIILYFLMGFLALLPGLGEGLDVIADASIFGNLAKIASAAGDGAVSIWQVVEDPSSAPMAIGGLLLGGLLRGRDDTAFEGAAGLRREMPDSVIQALGKDIKAGMDKVSSRYKKCGM